MTVIYASWADNNLKRYAKQIGVLQQRFPKILPQEINKVGDRAKTQVIRALTAQTGLPRKTIVKAVGNPTKAKPGRLSYDMVTRGGDIRLKYLAPRETRAGVSAIPWGKRQVFAGTFMKGGAFPDRKVVAKFNGHVFRRVNTSGTKITYARSGMFIPAEMTSGRTKHSFETIAGPLLQQRVEQLIWKMVK